ncbi:MAG: hypothetical protein IPH94_09565 [Saprospiraceae bacterium]|nr:hypothetical protein [Saprospiraceae bacterium]
MNGAHWHLVLNHLPIIIPIAALVILLISYAVDKPDFVRAAYLKQAGTTGGEIRHTEIRSSTTVGSGSAIEAQEEGDDD